MATAKEKETPARRPAKRGAATNHVRLLNMALVSCPFHVRQTDGGARGDGEGGAGAGAGIPVHNMISGALRLYMYVLHMHQGRNSNPSILHANAI